jgi:hypothetical protein
MAMFRSGVCVFAVSLAFAGAANAAGYTLTALGNLPGHNPSGARDINDAGQMVMDNGLLQYAFIWDPVSGTQDLGALGKQRQT